MREITEAILEALRSGRRAALATVVRVGGSTPQVPGARLLLRADFATVGTVGGGRIEQVVLEALAETLRDGKTRIVKKHLGRDLGMCCGGEMEVFVEPIESRPVLILFGAGHVALPTAAIAARVGFAVTVVDAREEQNTEERFPGMQRVLMEPVEAVRSGELPFGEEAYVVIATHDHRLDEDALRACLGKQRRYLGMIGSKRKVIRIFQRILQRDPAARLDDVHSPVGLDLGAHTPDEIGLAIASELVQVRRGGSGGSMRLDEKLVPRDEAASDDDHDDARASRS